MMIANQRPPEEPVCVQIARQIGELVAVGELPAGAPMPTGRVLADLDGNCKAVAML